MAPAPPAVPALPHVELDLDAACLREVDATGRGEAIRIWEATRPAVVLGHSGRLEQEVDAAACAADGVPILRRTTGGGAVVVGPGCLCFSLVLSLEDRPALRDVERSYATILAAVVRALGARGLARRGPSDLALGHRKVSGNAQRRGRRALLHHGTLLYACDVGLFSRYLREPPHPPAYRAGRPHEAFVTSLPLDGGEIRTRLLAAFGAPPWRLETAGGSRPAARGAPEIAAP